MVRTSIRCAFGAGILLICTAPLSAAPPQHINAGDQAAPNLFESVALPVSVTPYDLKWRLAWAGGHGPVAASPGAGPAEFHHLATVQRDVNQRLFHRDDPQASGGGDSWSTARVTFARGSGDCEDYAIAKAQRLLALGFRPRDLYLVIGNDLNTKAAHAILVVRSLGKFWVLNNLSSRVVDAEQFHDFDPVMTLSADRKWLHGYQKGARQRIAEAAMNRKSDSSPNLAAIKLAQRSRVQALPYAIQSPTRVK